VEVTVHGAKATDGDRKDLVQFFETLVDPFFPLETVLIGKQMGFPAASGKAVIPTTYGRIDQSAASFSHGNSPLRNIRFSPQILPNCKTNAIRCACPFFFFCFTICLGIAVDDTIHFLSRYQEERRHPQSIDEAIERAFQGVGTGMVMTTAVLVAGFASVTFSETRDYRVFGSLGAITLLTALICDLFMLPGLLKQFDRRSTESKTPNISS
jgi:hypothetical protein